MNIQTNMWCYVPAWVRLFWWTAERLAGEVTRVTGMMGGKHYNIRLK